MVSIIWTIRRNTLLRNTLLAFFLAALAGSVAEAQYVGAAKCRPCHIAQTKSWEPTKMAKAFESLKPGVAAKAKQAKGLDPAKDYRKDAECLSCHVTGHGQPGGVTSVGATPALAGVQCESCHGPGAGYLKPNLMSLQNKAYKRADWVAAGLVVPDARTCATCHNEKSPFYKPLDYEAEKKKVHAHVPLRFRVE
jgi:formate-dependent nitrite reductase cytochrome c552 subunit